MSTIAAVGLNFALVLGTGTAVFVLLRKTHDLPSAGDADLFGTTRDGQLYFDLGPFGGRRLVSDTKNRNRLSRVLKRFNFWSLIFVVSATFWTRDWPWTGTMLLIAALIATLMLVRCALLLWITRAWIRLTPQAHSSP